MISQSQEPKRIFLNNDATWWRQAAVYQIYPRSFADANGDGIGDLRGITSRVSYLKELGVEAVWMSPFYPSALADGGYDVDDYRNVDPRIGTLDDFAEMVTALHGAGIKIIGDVVPNHCSNLHEWFRAAVAAGKGSPERERFIFRDGKGKHGELPPNNWPSIFGGGAWTRVTEPDGTPGQWYFHIFAKEQPDLNWNHSDVREDFLTTLRFWCDRGVDGFRVDAAHFLTKDLDPSYDDLAQPMAEKFPDGQHPLYDRDDLLDIYQEWRDVFNEYDPPRFAVAEAFVPTHRQSRYTSTLGQVFSVDFIQARFNATDFHNVVDRNLRAVAEHGGSTTWTFSNHDVVRHATRYGLAGVTIGATAPGAPVTETANDGKKWLLDGGNPAEVDEVQGLRRARAATLFMLALPGSAYMYQGEELGLQEVGDIPDEYRTDPAFFRNRTVEMGRDGCRVPLPWTHEGSSFGFGPDGGTAPHLPQPDWFAHYAVNVESNDPGSTLNLYRRALALRHKLQCEETLEWVEVSHSVLAFVRPNGWCTVINFGTEPIELTPEGKVLVTSAPLEDGLLPSEGTAWLQL